MSPETGSPQTEAANSSPHVDSLHAHAADALKAKVDGMSPAELSSQLSGIQAATAEAEKRTAQDTLAAEGQKKLDDTLGTSSTSSTAVHPGESFAPKPTTDIVPPEGRGLDSETTKQSTTAAAAPEADAEGNQSYTVNGREFHVGQKVEYTSEKGTTAKYIVQPRVGGKKGTPDNQIVLKSVDNEQLQFATDNVDRIKPDDQPVDKPTDKNETGEDFVGYEEEEVNQDARDGMGQPEEEEPKPPEQPPREQPPEEPPTTPPTPPESQEKHTFTIGHVGSAHHRLARDVAGREIQTDRYDEEGNLKGRWDRFKNSLGRMFKQGMFREPIEGKRTKEAREDIRNNGHSQETTDAIIAKIEAEAGTSLEDSAMAHITEGLKLNPDVKLLDQDNAHYQAFEGEIKALLRGALQSEMSLEDFQARAQALVQNSAELTALLEESKLFVDRRDLVERFGDLTSYLEELRGIGNHEAALADIDKNFEVIIAESGLGASSELGEGSRFERVLESIARWSERHPKAGKIINETTIGVAVFIATKVATSGAKFVAPVLSIGVAAVIGAGRNNYHLRKDRILHARDVEMGEVSEYEEGDHSRRAQIDRSMYDILDVPSVLESLRIIDDIDDMTAESPERLIPLQVTLLAETLADIDARYEMQDQTGIGTFVWLTPAEAATMTDEQKLATVEQRKLSLALTRANMRMTIDKIAEARPDLFGVGEDSTVDTDALMAAKLREAAEDLGTEKTEKDRVFHKLQLKTAGRTMATIAVIGTAVGWLTHEAQEWWAGGKGAGVGEHVPLQKEPVTIGDGRNVQLAEGLQMHPSSSGGGNFDILDAQGHVVAANIHTGPSGVLSDESIAQLQGVKAGGGTLLVSKNNLETVAGPNVMRPATSDDALNSLRGTGELQHFARHFPGNEIDRYQLDLQPPRADGSIELTFTPKSAAAVADVRAGNGAALFTFKNAGLPADAPGAREGILVHLDTNGKAILTPDQFKGIDIAHTVARMGPDKYGAMPEGYIEAVGLHGHTPDGRLDLTSYATQRPTGGETFIPTPSTHQVGTAVIDIAKDPTGVDAPYIPITFNPDRALERIRHAEQAGEAVSEAGQGAEELIPDYWAAGYGEGATGIGALFAELVRQQEKSKGAEPGSDEKLPVDADDPANLPAIINLMLSPDQEIRKAANEAFARVMSQGSSSGQQSASDTTSEKTGESYSDQSLEERQQFIDELRDIIKSYSGKNGEADKTELSKQEKDRERKMINNFRRALIKTEEISEDDATAIMEMLDARIAAATAVSQMPGNSGVDLTNEIDRLRAAREQVEQYAAAYPDKARRESNTIKEALEEAGRAAEQAGEVLEGVYREGPASSLQPIDLTKALGRIREAKNGLPMTDQEVGEFLGNIDRYVTIAKIRFAGDPEKTERAVGVLESTRGSLLKYQFAKAGAGMTQADLVSEALEQTDKIGVLGVLDGIDKMPGGYIGSAGKKLSGQSIVRSISAKLRNINARAEAEEMTAGDVYYVYSVLDTFRKYSDRLTGAPAIEAAREKYNVLMDLCTAYAQRLMSGPALATAGAGVAAAPMPANDAVSGEAEAEDQPDRDNDQQPADTETTTEPEAKAPPFSDYKQGDEVVVTLNNGKKAFATVDADQNQSHTIRVRLNDGSYQDMPPEQVEFRATS